MASIPFEKLRSVDQKTKDLVEGFIRSVLQNENIPSLILTICISFYYLGEFFSICGKGMVIDDDMTMLKVCSLKRGTFVRNTGYGNIKIENAYHCIYSWAIKLVAMDIYNTYIGIDASDKAHVNRNFAIVRNEYYVIDAKGTKKYRTVQNNKHQRLSYGKKLNEGDIVKMEINTENKTMQFWINDEDQGIAFENITFDDFEYHLAISLCTDKQNYAHCVKLLDFKQIAIKM